MNEINYFFYDFLIKYAKKPNIHPDIKLITVDRASLKKLKRKPNIADYTQLLQHLSHEKVKAILLLDKPNDLLGTVTEQEAFAKIADSIPNFYVGVDILPLKGNESSFILPPPMDTLSLKTSNISRDKINYAGDGVSRRAILWYENKFFIQAQLAQLIGGPTKLEEYSNLFNFKGSYQTLTNYAPANSYPHSSFYNVLIGKYKTGNFSDKIIIIGTAAGSESANYVRTPYSKDVTAMSVVEYHANLIQTFANNNGIKKASEFSVNLITLVLTIIIIFSVFSLTPTHGIILITSSSIILFVISVVAFPFLIWLPIAQPLLGIFLSYYLLIPYRLITEHKKSWEYQEKNRLLTQVEELKDNFISMMSHDLKTPLARIHGMAELTLNENKNLSSQQVEALQTINQSTEDLSLFINSVLSLGKIESKGVELKLTSHDINKLIEKVIKKCDFLAKRKNISIMTELEPLFSIPIDPVLMQQVLQNLVENAIKYSPANTKILVATEEMDGQVQIQVSDQGNGIPKDELDKIFMKFYRSKDANSSPIKGSGLGLYLTKYFINLHNGNIEVDSIPNKGSTFTIHLPIELGN